MTTAPPTEFRGDPEVTPDLVKEHGLTDREYQQITEILGRQPTFTELGIFSALWSEHCAYKHSKKELQKFPTEGSAVVQGPGENAGILSLGDGWVVAFKMESHNHPSAVEPYEGAATGVGGILRDVFTMGARPIALLNSLRFGPLDQNHNRYLLAGVVRGIGDYGNCVGVPTLGGEVDFMEPYSGNPLVNAMCVGVMRKEHVIRAIARGVGNVLISVGARTGRDGIHGASFASVELSEESEEKRPQVQVGDPFTEKLLIEASLELIRSGDIVAIQDMGAAGLTSSSAEMADRGGVGVEIDAAAVPTREPDMTPYEILLSESQERMLVVAEPDKVDAVRTIAEKWELEATVVGRVTDDGQFRVRWNAQTVAAIPGEQLVKRSPVYSPPSEEDPAIARLRDETVDTSQLDPEDALRRLLATPALANKRWVHEQYDSTVRASSVVQPGLGAGVVTIPDTTIGIAMATDCNSRYVMLDPYEGAKGAVAESARNIACTGARPIGITNCLNFGSPEKPHVYHQFKDACRGIGDACRVLETPVTGGNVSFYNESPTGAVPPTPVIGMIGLLSNVRRTVRPGFRDIGDRILLLGRCRGHLGGSSLWAHVMGRIAGAPPPVDLAAEKALIDLLIELSEKQLLKSAADLSDGGLGVALAECCFGTPYTGHTKGASVSIGPLLGDGVIPTLFGEDHGRALVSVSPGRVASVLAAAEASHVPATVLGEVAEDRLGVEWGTGSFSAAVDELRGIYDATIPEAMSASVEV